MDKILIDKSVLEQALEALENSYPMQTTTPREHEKTITTLRAVMTQPVPLETEFKFRSWYWYDDREGYWDYTDDPDSRLGQKWEPNPQYISKTDEQSKESLPDNCDISLRMQCEACGHIQVVRGNRYTGQNYFGSSYDWCDNCDGLPKPIEDVKIDK
jgi:hypothetical protein